MQEGRSTYGVEVGLERLAVGQAAGRQVFFSPAPSGQGDSGWCPGPLVLKERRDDGAYVFTKATERGDCGSDEFRARLVDGDRLILEWYWSRGPKPDAAATLERKR